MKTRYCEIDFLRAIGLLGVIAIHVLYFNLNSTIEFGIWDYLHFVVAALVFCSGYVLSASPAAIGSFGEIVRWYKKRLLRLAVPYFWFVGIYGILMNLFPSLFAGIGIQKNMSSLISAFTFSPRVDVSWLPLLFIQLTLLFPFLIYLHQRKKLWIYVLFAGITTLLISIRPFPINYYWYMWNPWSLIVILAMYMQRSIKKNYLYIGIFSGGLFLLLYILWSQFGRTLVLRDNEYPPNIYHLVYGVFVSMVLLFFGTTSFFNKDNIKKAYTYISVNSYSLYFIHYIVLDFVVQTRKWIGSHGPFLEFVVVLLISLGIYAFINILTSIYKKR